MQDYEQASLERLQAATAGIDLTSGEQKTLKWISGWETSTVDNVAHIIEKAKGTEKAGELTQDDLFKLWGFLETLKNISNPAKNEQALLRFLAPLSVLPFGLAAASEYGELRAFLQRQGTPIGPLDMLIAGHARAEKLVLVTSNVREFERVPELEFENWAE